MDSSALGETLHWLASNHRWTWAPACRRLLFSLPGAKPGMHPVEIVAQLTPGQLDELLADNDFMSLVHGEIAELDRILAGQVEPQVVYASPEFGIDALVPQYSGGLGVLAGDHLKAASDLGLPLVGVGLFYREGYFNQIIEHGHQAEVYRDIAPAAIGAKDTGVVITVPLPGREVAVKVWRLDVGRVPLLMLDTDLESNDHADRAISDRLYGGDRLHRIEQEMVLGVGGARAVAALGWDTPLHHMNEGHAGFMVLEMIDRVISGADLPTAVASIGSSLVFTTHTPVPAGIDRFHREQILPFLQLWAERWGVDVEDLWELGEDPDEPGDFNMAALTLRLCTSANGVSQLHGEVSRELFAGVGCGDQIGSVTNGVHARTWVGPDLQTVFDSTLGPSWSEGDPSAWDRVDVIDDESLGSLRRAASLRLSQLVADRSDHSLDPDALIIGFARRFAPYKRATLLLEHVARLESLLGDDGRPVHFVFSGKAHPLDGPGKAMLAQIVGHSASHSARGRFTFLPGYDMAVGAALVAGCDVWLNNPVRPHEASGTSGEKAALNGGLNCSILDGWWAEMYDGRNGWAIASSDATEPERRDQEEATFLMDTLEAIRDEYYADRPGFQDRIRHAWRTLGPQVTAARMVRDYSERVYGPALERAPG